MISESRVQFREVRGDHDQLRIVPRSGANPIFGMFGLIIRAFFNAQVGVPCFGSGTDRCCEILALFIGVRESAEVCGHAARAGHEKAERRVASAAAARSGFATYAPAARAIATHTARSAGTAATAAGGGAAATAATATGRIVRVVAAPSDGDKKTKSQPKARDGQKTAVFSH